MGEKDILEKSLCAYNDVFADIVNILLFCGEDRVEEDKLVNVFVHKAYNGSKRFREIERDVAKNWCNTDFFCRHCACHITCGICDFIYTCSWFWFKFILCDDWPRLNSNNLAIYTKFFKMILQ